MALLDEAKSLSPRKGPTCGVGLFLSSLSDELAAEVVQVLHDPGCTDSGLVEALKARGFDPPRVQVWGTHRRGGCKCDG